MKLNINIGEPNTTRTVFMVMDTGADTENPCFATLAESRQYINLNPNYRKNAPSHINEISASYDADGDLIEESFMLDSSIIAEHAIAKENDHE